MVCFLPWSILDLVKYTWYQQILLEAVDMLYPGRKSRAEWLRMLTTRCGHCAEQSHWTKPDKDKETSLFLSGFFWPCSSLPSLFCRVMVCLTKTKEKCFAFVARHPLQTIKSFIDKLDCCGKKSLALNILIYDQILTQPRRFIKRDKIYWGALCITEVFHRAWQSCLEFYENADTELSACLVN